MYCAIPFMTEQCEEAKVFSFPIFVFSLSATLTPKALELLIGPVLGALSDASSLGMPRVHHLQYVPFSFFTSYGS
jgi:hypothetical protein